MYTLFYSIYNLYYISANVSFMDILYTVLIISIDHDTSKDDNNVKYDIELCTT